MDSGGRGAYGFRLDYADPGEHLNDLIELDDSAPLVSVGWRHASTIRDVEEVAENLVVYGARGGATFRVDRDPPSVLIDLPSPPPPHALVHPLLTVGISVHARWRGDVTLHAGAFETRSGAWGVMGEREAGKSSILAALAVRGLPIVADDLLAVDGMDVWAGPRCVDLRPDTAPRFRDARLMGVVGGRPRFRLSTPPGRARLPFGGFFVLGWHDDNRVVVEPMRPQERLQWLYQQEYIRLFGWPDPAKHLSLLTLPAWSVRRPADWGATDEVLGRMLEIAAGAIGVAAAGEG